MTTPRYIENVASLKLEEDRCIGCDLCTVVCPHGVFVMKESKANIADLGACIECGACVINCPTEALAVKKGVGCASAIINGWLTGEEPNCDCGGSC